MEVSGTERRVCEDIARRQQYGRWTLICLMEKGKHEKWLAQCSCGKEKTVYLCNLKTGRSTSCGCHRKELSQTRNTTHGQTGKTRTYKCWSHMKGRCLNEKDHAYKDYGGRGIKVCERWMKFENFFQDMGHCPPEHSIERVNVNGDYEPSNCVWLHITLQARNTRANRFTQKDVDNIRFMLAEGESVKNIAKKYGASTGHIRQIRDNIIWKQ